MLRTYCSNGKSLHLIICDACGGQITDGRMALAVWPAEMTQGGTSPIQHVHKDLLCQGAMEASMAKFGRQMAAEELGSHLLYLVQNTGFSLDDLRRIIRMWESIDAGGDSVDDKT